MSPTSLKETPADAYAPSSHKYYCRLVHRSHAMAKLAGDS